MDCPVCKKEPMIVLELDQVEIDYCFACEGIWLDAGELELLLESSQERDKVLSAFRRDNTSKEKRRKCPICLRRMDKVFCGQDGKLLIDKCRSSHGLWFDKGELHKIIELGSLDKNNKILNILNDMFSPKPGKTKQEEAEK